MKDFLKKLVPILGIFFSLTLLSHNLLAVVDSDGDGLLDYQEININTDPNNPDTDGDGASDFAEVTIAVESGTVVVTPNNSDGDIDNTSAPGASIIDALESSIIDTDSDTVVDQDDPENYNPCSPSTAVAACTGIVDTDGDGVDDALETAVGTDPNVDDTDGDGLTDLFELNHRSSATVADTDGDGSNDGFEVDLGSPTRARDVDIDSILDLLEGEGTANDTDGDGEPDEIDPSNADPCIPDDSVEACTLDTDGDGLTDFQENEITDSSATVVDTDGDGINDGAEALGPGSADPASGSVTNAQAHAAANTTSTLVGEDVIDMLDPCVPDDTDPNAPCDPDGDNLTNASETIAGTSPTVADTDGDGVNDDVEVGADVNNPINSDPSTAAIDALDPCYPSTSSVTCDADGDGLTNGEEDPNSNSVVDSGETDPNNPDTDGDGYNDGEEVTGVDQTSTTVEPTGTSDPLNPCDPDTSSVTCPDTDTDSDGLLDRDEDKNQNGTVDPGETDPTNPDTDGDGVDDGDEVGSDVDNPLNSSSDDNPDVIDALDPCYPNTSSVTCLDTDGDGLLDRDEDKNQNGELDPGETDPNNPDTDGDGTGDRQEVFGTDSSGSPSNPKNSSDLDDPDVIDALDPCYPDSYSILCDRDDDGLLDRDEDKNRDGTVDPGETDPNNPDTDGDGVDDGDEVGSDVDNPLNSSSDDDPDVIDALDPCYPSTSSVTCPDTDTDTDGDGLLDRDEDKNQNGELDPGETDPNNPDTDNDGVNDGDEVGSDVDNPLNSSSDDDPDVIDARDPCYPDPNAGDCDPEPPTCQGIFDFVNPFCDNDNDGLNNFLEFFGPTLLNTADTDGDGYNDGEEVTGIDQTSTAAIPTGTSDATDPCDPDPFAATCPGTDTDGDGLPDRDEDKNQNGTVDPGETDPNKPDTDGDGVGDQQEVGADANNPLNLSDADDPDVIDARDPCYPNPNASACSTAESKRVRVYHEGSGAMSWPLLLVTGALLLILRRRRNDTLMD